MKFPESLSQLISKSKDTPEHYFSLILCRDGAAVATWSMDEQGELTVASMAHAVLKEDTWDGRMSVVDELLSLAEDKAEAKDTIAKTVFGMPTTYLTKDGDIPSDIRAHLKKLSTSLELAPVGFVPLTQAIAFSLKKDEGVPPSVILIHCMQDSITVSLYRVGVCVREETLEIKESVAYTLEEFLNDAGDTDVLPSRMLLYGMDPQVLEHARGSLLKHQWPSKANFLHFPKIEVISHDHLVKAVSLAGSAEMTAMGDEPTITDAHEESTVVAQPTRNTSEDAIDEKDVFIADQDAEDGEDLDDDAETKEETEVEQPMHLSAEDDEDVENIEMVEAESMGFGSQDVMEKQAIHHDSMGDEEMPKKKHTLKKFAFALPAFSLPNMSALRGIKIPRFLGSSSSLIAIFGVVGTILLFGLLYYFVPRAAVTVFVLPNTLSETATITIDPTSTVVDSATKTIPGLTQELSLSSQKTVPVTGKKKVGDPAKGTITFYNKVTSERTLKKGTVLVAKGLSFSLDEETKIASASESISGDSITFGKKDATLTAVDIGTEGNVAASTEFVVKDISSSTLSAKNDKIFAGGVSRDVTVVSRADLDGAVKTLSDDIVLKAKAQLLAQVGGNRLIEQTIKTKVSEKQFDKELDQEAKEISGNVTASVSGIVIRDEDVKSLLVSLVTPKLPAGYSFTDGKTDVSLGAVQVKKDGKITVAATVSATALPIISIENIQKNISGKSVTDALTHLKALVGVAGAEFRFVLSPTNSRLPINKANITISIAVQ